MLSFGAIYPAGQSPAPFGWLPAHHERALPMPITTRGVVAIVGRKRLGVTNDPTIGVQPRHVTATLCASNSSIGPLGRAGVAGVAIALQIVRAGSQAQRAPLNAREHGRRQRTQPSRSPPTSPGAAARSVLSVAETAGHYCVHFDR